MKRNICFLFFISLILSNCVSLRPSEKELVRELEHYGIKTKEVQAIKNPGLSAGLNVLPGVGNFYLASGSGESEQWIIGGLNLLTWPWSIFWGVPQAAIDAETINQRTAIDYYKYDKHGKKELVKLRKENNYNY